MLFSGEKIKYFATVVQHDLERVVRVDSQGRPHPVVGLHFREQDMLDVLKLVGRGVVPGLSLVQASEVFQLIASLTIDHFFK